MLTRLEVATYNIGRHMKALREQKGISVEIAALECDISPDMIRSFESGQVICPAFILFCYAKLLDEPMESFLDEAYDRFKRSMAEPIFVTRMREAGRSRMS